MMTLSDKNISPKLSLVGAGPGDPDLITIKAVKAIADADVILYDALINTELLKYASEKAKKIFVGKRAGKHIYSQEEINKLIIENAFAYGHVVRLKGGDPFVFGRGHEELEYAKSFNIPVEIIPGISSSIAIPELQTIPLTKRGITESFWVITGTTSNGELSNDIYKAAESDATIVILMGMKNLKEISEIFIKAGKGETPAAIIENGSLPNEKIILGKIDTIFNKAAKENISSPSVIVFGEVVSLHPDFEHSVRAEKNLFT